ncbi:hypothetical protein ACYULU_02990 [Breznakiellaceae bacterium SP9]
MNKNIYGFQIQPQTKWKNGLSRNEIREFENTMGLKFPEILFDYYTVMNGINKDQKNLYGGKYEPKYSTGLYSFPDDINEIKNLIQWIYEENEINEKDMERKNISRIFPIYAHRFILIDHPQNPILSMYGNDVILFANNILHLFYIDLLKNDNNIKLNEKIKINYWLD